LKNLPGGRKKVRKKGRAKTKTEKILKYQDLSGQVEGGALGSVDHLEGGTRMGHPTFAVFYKWSPRAKTEVKGCVTSINGKGGGMFRM